MLYTIYYILYAIYYILYAIYYILYAICYIPHSTHYVLSINPLINQLSYLSTYTPIHASFFSSIKLSIIYLSIYLSNPVYHNHLQNPQFPRLIKPSPTFHGNTKFVAFSN